MGMSHSKIVPVPQKADLLQSHHIHVDPRSPTVNISRSPINSEHCYALNVTKGKDLTSVLSEIPESVQTPERRLAERFQSIVDPRSPTVFTRTPLTVPCVSPNADSVADESSIQYAEISINDEDDAELSFKDCETMPAIGDLHILNDEQSPVESVVEKLEQTIYEDAVAPTYLGFDPRSPSIQIDRTPIILRDVEEEEEGDNGKALSAAQSGMNDPERKQQPLEEQPSLCQTPTETTPKRTKESGTSAIKGPRTPLSCMTNAYASGGGGNSIRKTALLGHIKQNNMTDGKKQTDRTLPTGSAEVSRANKEHRRSKIPTLRMS